MLYYTSIDNEYNVLMAERLITPCKALRRYAMKALTLFAIIVIVGIVLVNVLLPLIDTALGCVVCGM